MILISELSYGTMMNYFVISFVLLTSSKLQKISFKYHDYNYPLNVGITIYCVSDNVDDIGIINKNVKLQFNV